MHILFLIILYFSVITGVEAAEIKALVTIAVQGITEELAPQFERQTGHKLTIAYGLSPILAKRVADGERVDFIISTRSGIDSLLKTQRVNAGGDVALGKSLIAIAVRSGTPRPDISTADALKNTILAAKSIGYTNPAAGGPSGVHFAKVLDILGIADDVKAKTKFPPVGGFVGQLLVDGQIDLAIQQFGELMAFKGVDIVGPLPGALQNATSYVAAVTSDAREPEAAKAFLAFLRSPEGRVLMKQKGVDPD